MACKNCSGGRCTHSSCYDILEREEYDEDEEYAEFYRVGRADKSCDPTLDGGLAARIAKHLAHYNGKDMLMTDTYVTVIQARSDYGAARAKGGEDASNRDACAEEGQIQRKVLWSIKPAKWLTEHYRWENGWIKRSILASKFWDKFDK